MQMILSAVVIVLSSPCPFYNKQVNKNTHTSGVSKDTKENIGNKQER